MYKATVSVMYLQFNNHLSTAMVSVELAVYSRVCMKTGSNWLQQSLWLCQDSNSCTCYLFMIST